MDTDFRGVGEFNFVGNHRRRGLNSRGLEWRNELQIGHSQRINAELFQPLLPTETLASFGAEQRRRVAEISVPLPNGSGRP